MSPGDRIRDRKIGVVGLARSGESAALLAAHLGGKPFVSDAAAAHTLTGPLARLAEKGIPVETDGHTDRVLESEYLVVSPGVPPNASIILRARERGIPIFSEVEFASWVCPARIVAITGTNGKTTTTTLVGEIAKAGGFNAFVCGNIGLPLSDIVLQATAESLIVLEISSAQLEDILDFAPAIATILNITPDHLDRYGTFEKYRKAKYRIGENMREAATLLLNLDDAGAVSSQIDTRAEKRFFTVTDHADAMTCVANDTLSLRTEGKVHPIIHRREIKIPGPHNLQNAAAAVAIGSLLGVDGRTMADTLRTFAGVEHRLEFVARVAGITFINDSKATNVDSVCWALRSVETPVYLIAGGRHKGASYAPIADIAQGKIQAVIAIGEARDLIKGDLSPRIPVKFAASLDEAVQMAFSIAHPGDTVLLSPGCSSFDMFENYEQRGRQFKTAVRGLRNGNASHTTIAHR